MYIYRILKACYIIIIYKVYLFGCCGALLMVCPSAADLFPSWLFWSCVSFLMCGFAFAVLFRLYVSILH